MLDSSFSMEGDPWSDLMKCVSDFFSNLEGDVLSRQKSKVSVITYDHNATLVIYKQTPSKSLVSKIKFTEGKTNFAKPL